MKVGAQTEINSGQLLNGEDRRRSELKLSAKGYKIFDQIVPLVLAYEQKILSALPAQEQNQLLAILDKLEAAELALKP